MAANLKDVTAITEFIIDKYGVEVKNRMIARLLDNMGIDSWMTFELMGAAIRRVIQNDPFKGSSLIDTKRDVWSSTTANALELHGKSVDHFYNFQTIKIDSGEGVFRHGNRPDGTFKMEIETSTGTEPMVLFYEGDNHSKDDAKTLDRGCRNSHKIYQYFAQSQSYNPSMSACTIIASIDRVSEDFQIFLDDLFKAHMFAFTAIAHYNMTSDKKQTCLHTIMGLEAETYDFVFGINMGFTSDSVPFETSFFDDRMSKLKSFQNFNACNIRILDLMKAECPTKKKTIKIGLVRMVFIAVPRNENRQIDNPQSPFFIYPQHVERLLTWIKTGKQKQRAEVAINVTSRIFQCLNVPAMCKFRKNMMDVTNVLQVPNQGIDDKRFCSFDETSGFFFIALPLAYYTIQQFEVVNGRLKYNWNEKFKDFNKVFDVMKDKFFDLNTTKIKVRMYKDKENTSLFHQICESIDKSTQNIEKDLQMFLQESCKWKEVDEYSPVIFFRTMGIFSLQNAIDFAFEIQRTESKTYLNMLSSYPVGTQILIRQCIHKLTDVTAFAYLERDSSIPKPTSTEEDDQDPGDEEDTNVVVKLILAAKDQVAKFLKSIGWVVNFEQSYAEQDKADIGDDLIRCYSESISDWNYIESPPTTDIQQDTNNAIQSEYIKNSKNTAKTLKKNGIAITSPDMIVTFVDNSRDFYYKPVFLDKFVCDDKKINEKIQRITISPEERVTVQWKTKKITFIRMGENQMKEIMASVNRGTKTNFEKFRDMLTGNTRNP